MSQKAEASYPPGTQARTPRWARNVFWGAIIGFVVGLVAIFGLAVFYGESIGMAPGACTAFACSITLLLSQPAGIGGMVAGAAAGAVLGGLAHLLHRG